MVLSTVVYGMTILLILFLSLLLQLQRPFPHRGSLHKLSEESRLDIWLGISKINIFSTFNMCEITLKSHHNWWFLDIWQDTSPHF